MRDLEPTVVWKHFATLCAIPRPSKQEDALRRHLLDWAASLGLAAAIDAAGNLLIRKKASAGRETRAGLVLQAHLDMVCQANAGASHDFTMDPIQASIRDGWLWAERTTLGADNGIGVALAMAALEEQDLLHPPLEVLFTVDEEAGMGGARGLAPGVLQGARMLNLDTEEWGEFFMGCAGGADVSMDLDCAMVDVPDGYGSLSLAVGGLKGGHSGCDIHLGRGNANKILTRLLRQLATRTDLRLAAFAGGTARNALPREAVALVAFPAADGAAVERFLTDYRGRLRAELAGTDDGVWLSGAAAACRSTLPADTQTALLGALDAAPHGVRRMSDTCPGVVETSSNLGMVALKDGTFTANQMVRSLLDSATEALAGEIAALFAGAGCRSTVSGSYPSWTPDPGSPLLELCQGVFRREFGTEARTQVIHAGLECGIIGAKYPGLDTVSFGPTIRGAHAPGETVEIATVGQAWRLLRAIMAEV